MTLRTIDGEAQKADELRYGKEKKRTNFNAKA